MSQDNVQRVRALTGLWNAGVREVPPGYFDPAVELHSPFSSVSGRPYRGLAGVLQWIRDVDDQFSEWQIREEDTREIGDSVIQIGTIHGHGRGSGIDFEQRTAVVLDFGADELIMSVRIYWEVDDGLKAVGLEE